MSYNTDIERIGERTETSVEVVRAVADLVGDDYDAIIEALNNPADFDEIISRAHHFQRDMDEPLYWSGKAVP